MINKEIKLNDLLKIHDLENVRIKLNKFNGVDDPIDLFQKDPDLVNNQWLFWREKRRFFNVGQIAINLIRVQGDVYLLTTIKRVTKELGLENNINYEGEELDRYQPFFGRVLVKFHKNFSTAVVGAAQIINQMVVSQLLPDVYTNQGFPGYDSVCLSYSELKSALERYKSEWIAALSNQKAVYLIRDKCNGKVYVGSATSQKGMLLNRWKSYIANGHGGNKSLKNLVMTRGFDYVKKYFQYSILENYNARVDDSLILKRETWWKNTFDSRNPKFGYNDN